MKSKKKKKIKINSIIIIINFFIILFKSFFSYEQDDEEKEGILFFRDFDFFDIVKYMSRNSLGREIVFDYVRINYDNLIKKYTLDDPRIGQMLIDISFSFETKFILNEV